MSTLTIILAIVAIGLANIFVYWFVDRILSDRLDPILTGVRHGIPMSKEERRASLWWYTNSVVGAVGGHVGLGLLYLVAANNAVAADVATILSVVAVIVFAGSMSWVGTGIIWYRRVAAILR